MPVLLISLKSTLHHIWIFKRIICQYAMSNAQLECVERWDKRHMETQKRGNHETEGENQSAFYKAKKKKKMTGCYYCHPNIIKNPEFKRISQMSRHLRYHHRIKSLSDTTSLKSNPLYIYFLNYSLITIFLSPILSFYVEYKWSNASQMSETPKGLKAIKLPLKQIRVSL